MKALLAIAVAAFTLGLAVGPVAAQRIDKQTVKKPPRTCMQACHWRHGDGSRNAYSLCMSTCQGNYVRRKARAS